MLCRCYSRLFISTMLRTLGTRNYFDCGRPPIAQNVSKLHVALALLSKSVNTGAVKNASKPSTKFNVFVFETVVSRHTLNDLTSWVFFTQAFTALLRTSWVRNTNTSHRPIYWAKLFDTHVKQNMCTCTLCGASDFWPCDTTSELQASFSLHVHIMFRTNFICGRKTYLLRTHYTPKEVLCGIGTIKVRSWKNNNNLPVALYMVLCGECLMFDVWCIYPTKTLVKSLTAQTNTPCHLHVEKNFECGQELL